MIPVGREESLLSETTTPTTSSKRRFAGHATACGAASRATGATAPTLWPCVGPFQRLQQSRGRLSPCRLTAQRSQFYHSRETAYYEIPHGSAQISDLVGSATGRGSLPSHSSRVASCCPHRPPGARRNNKPLPGSRRRAEASRQPEPRKLGLMASWLAQKPTQLHLESPRPLSTSWAHCFPCSRAYVAVGWPELAYP